MIINEYGINVFLVALNSIKIKKVNNKYVRYY